MTNTFDLVHLKGEVYVVDDKFPIGGKFIARSEKFIETNGTIKSFQRLEGNDKLPCHVNESWNANWYYPDAAFGVFHVLATTDKSLGLPLLPAVEEDVEKLLHDAILAEFRADPDNGKNPELDNYWKNVWGIWWGLMDTNIRTGLMKVLKASTKKYTEEDLLKYMELRMEIWKRITKEEIESGRYKKRENPFEWTEKEVHRLAVLALNPKPKQVEVEIEAYEIVCDEPDCVIPASCYHQGKPTLCGGGKTLWRPKVVNGFVQVKRWIF